GRLELAQYADGIAIGDVGQIVLVPFQVGDQHDPQIVGRGNLAQVFIRLLLGQLHQMQVRVAGCEVVLFRLEDRIKFEPDFFGPVLAQIEFLGGKGTFQAGKCLDADFPARQCQLRTARGKDVPAPQVIGDFQSLKAVQQSGQGNGSGFLVGKNAND